MNTRPWTGLIFGLFLLMTVALPAQETHRVEANQTLYSIARLYHVTLADLMSWNNLKDTRIRPGQTLVVKPAVKWGVDLPGDTYVVKPGDTLESVSAQFSLTPAQLKQYNDLESDVLPAGRRLAVRPPRAVETYVVQAGDTLLGLSGRYGLTLDELKAVNNLDGTALKIGQELRVSRPANRPLTHEVKKMDSLEGLALLYKMDAGQIKALNNLKDNTVYPGQVLRLSDTAVASAQNPLNPAGLGGRSGPQSTQGSQSPRAPQPLADKDSQTVPQTEARDETREHRVTTGETFYSIARRYGVGVNDLIRWNQMDGKVLKTGQVLTLRAPRETTETVLAAPVTAAPVEASAPLSPPGAKPASPQELRWESFVVLDKDIPLFEWNNDFYYWSHPGQTTQPNRGYYENQWTSPLAAYNKARRLWEGFENLLEGKPLKSNVLKGITIVLDPGHGGLDPGAIVKSADGLGDTLYVTEDEYVHDIALRMVPLLREHGAQVQLTVLAPNHLIRDTTPATRTLIHEKNEVFNSLELNQGNTVEAWPVGGAAGLERRVKVAQELFARYPGESIFISLHADNAPGSPRAVSVLYQGSDDREDKPSEGFATHLANTLGSGAYSKPRDLGVLRNNPASKKVLVEVRNVAYQEHAWALRFANTRQMDALNLVEAILDYYREKS